MIFQDANLLPWRTLEKNIQLPFELKRTRPDRARIQQLLERVGLTGFNDKYPRELSGGMQQRASIVRSLAVDPSVLLMDEPFGALDAFTRDEMNLLIQEIWMETGKTIAFVTHSIPEAIFLADRIVVMSARPGRVASVYDVDIPRPRPVEIQTQPDFIARVMEIKTRIDHQRGATRRSFDDRLSERTARTETGWTGRCGTRSRPSTRRTRRRRPVGIAGGLSASLAERRRPDLARDLRHHPRRGHHHRRRRVPARPGSRCRNTSCRRRARS